MCASFATSAWTLSIMDTVKCRVCDQAISKAEAQKDQCFLYLPLKTQIQKLLQDHHLGKYLTHRFEQKDPSIIKDVYDGQMYKCVDPSFEQCLANGGTSAR